jgi:AcrR family transcriptional regulator
LQSPGELRALGLRERKKARTRAAIQRHALRLIRRQGYDATTVSQIAEAAEVSESTFFRYFPTKEDVVLWDEFDPRVIDVFMAQPPGTRAVAALRTAIRQVLRELPADDQAALRERMDLMLAVPDLRLRMLDQVSSPMRLFGELLAQQSGRQPDDPAILAVTGAIIGVSIAVMFAFAERPDTDLPELLDQALAHLDAGLPL